jgi:large conductance mechanosensitive channel protein
MIKEFKEFITKGNLIDLAVAFILGVAFATVVSSFTNVALAAIGYVFGGDVSFDQLGVKRNGVVVIPYGAFLTALINFVIVAFILFLVVRTYNRMRKTPDATTKTCSFCQTAIPLTATRCPNCTSDLQPDRRSGKSAVQ